MEVVITGSGVVHPESSISNQELVDAFNQYVKNHNTSYQQQIERGERQPLEYSDAAFIEKASGIKSRYVIEKEGILNPQIMHPVLDERADGELSIQAEYAVKAAKQAMANAKITSEDVDAVIIACSNMQRAYPAIAIEVQQALAINGFAYDMNVACSSATYGIHTAESFIRANQAQTVLVISPEFCSAHLNFRDRDSHFIFGDATSALVIQDKAAAKVSDGFKILSSKLQTEFSNNIRNNAGFLNRLTAGASALPDKLFKQNGRKVFKEVTIKVTQLIAKQLESLGIKTEDLSRLWLHQANLNMNQLIASKLLGKEPSSKQAPVILDEYANTSSAGSIIAFHFHHQDLNLSDKGLICSFGAGYSIGSIVVEKIAI